MSLPNLKTEAGRGGLLGRSRMSHDYCDDPKAFARKLRRLFDRRECAALLDPVDPATVGRRVVARKNRRLSENNLRRNPGPVPRLQPDRRLGGRRRGRLPHLRTPRAQVVRDRP